MPLQTLKITLLIGLLFIGTVTQVPCLAQQSGKPAYVQIFKKNCPQGPHDIYHLVYFYKNPDRATLGGSEDEYKIWYNYMQPSYNSVDYKHHYNKELHEVIPIFEKWIKAWNVPANYKPCSPTDEGRNPPLKLQPISPGNLPSRPKQPVNCLYGQC